MKILTNLAVKRKIAAAAIICALSVLGAISYFQMPVDFLPSIVYPLIKIHIWWPGATPKDIEENIADPVEQEMATVEGMDYLESSSIEGSYTLQVSFKYGWDVNIAFQDAQAAMVRVAKLLPKDIEPPVVMKADPSQLPVVQLTIRSNIWDMVKIRDWAENWLTDRILAVPGVSGIETVGGLKREIRIHLDVQALEKYKISPVDIKNSLAGANLEMFGGRVNADHQELIARTMGRIKSLEQIRKIVLKEYQNKKIYLEDLAEVVDGHEEVRIHTRHDQIPSVKLSVQKQPDANTVEVSEAVEKKIRELEKTIPEHLKLGTVESQAKYINSAVSSVKTSATQAVFLVLIISLLFLSSFRQAMILLTVLPLSLLINFGIMRLGGFTINIFSLAGIVVSIGILLDNSIVVLENISARIENKQRGGNKVAIKATDEVGGAIFASTLTILALFVPYLLVSGFTSLLFRELIMVIAGVVIVSLFCSLTVVPLLASFLKKKSSSKKPAFLLKAIQLGYSWFLDKLLTLRWLVLAAFLAVFGLGISSYSSLGSEFLPKLDDGRIMVKVRLPTGSALESTNKVLNQIEKKLVGDPLIESAFTLAGGKIWGLYTFEVANEGEINIQLVPNQQRSISTGKYIKKLKKKVQGLAPPGGKIMVKQMRIKGIRKMGVSDLEFQVRGSKLDKLFSLAQKINKISKENPDLTNVRLGMDLDKPEYLIEIDRKRAGDLGIKVKDVATTVQTFLHGTVVSRYFEQKEFYNIRIRIPEAKIRKKEDVENLLISGKNGEQHYLREIASVNRGTGPVEIIRENQLKQVVVRADVADVSVGGALNKMKRKLSELDLPPGYELGYGGKSRRIVDLKESAGSIFSLALFLAMVVLAVQFNNLRYPILILSSIPFCLSGVFFALDFTNYALGSTVLIGLLVVIAATISDGVLLFTLADELKLEDPEITTRKAIKTAAIRRMRPRIMTTVTTIAGFIPLSFNVGASGNLLKPMAIAAIGGLAFEILVALFLMPCLYLLISSPFRTSKPNKLNTPNTTSGQAQ
ncbi:MAG: efflux RND transporter permease subunit [Myxococcota bacterium]